MNSKLKKDIKSRIEKTINDLSNPTSYNKVYHTPSHGVHMPSTEDLKRIVDIARETLFPGYFGNDILEEDTIQYYTGVNIDSLNRLLVEQIKRGLCFDCFTDETPIKCNDCTGKAEHLAATFIEQLPKLRHLLATDIIAAYDGDPAAKSYGEIIFCYPVIKALINYRIAHELVLLNVPLIPRIISELAHSETGIDINPEAQIGEYFTIDHGTGVVIGATCIIGKHVQLYQGVTLGAKSFPIDDDGKPIKGIPRHPIVEDNVVIYANATILGRITVGENSVIGGNVWITQDVPAGSKIMQSKAKSFQLVDGAGI